MTEPRQRAASERRTGAVPRVEGDGGPVHEALRGAELRPREPLYRATWWETRFPWLLEVLVALDPEPLWKRLAPLSSGLGRVAELACTPAASLLESATRAAGRVRRSTRTSFGRALRAVPLPGLLRDWLWLRPIELAGTGHASAQALWRQRGRRAGPVALLVAGALHLALFALWPAMTLEGIASGGEELEAITLPPTVEVPPAPEPIARPATPVMTSTVADDVTIAPTTFEAQPPVAELVAPVVEEVEQPRRPTVTPFTVAPEILNADEVRGLLITEYPPLLRQAGVGGAIVMWFYLAADGRVVEVRIARGSGYEELDAAAYRVAEHIRFSPALNRDQYVAAWVQFPIEFRVRE